MKAKMKVFISYCSADNNKMKLFEKILTENANTTPIIIANRKNPQKLLTEKVIEGIEESDVVVPIITKKSIYTQWINQEIGFAIAKKKNIMPIVEKTIIDNLKGFIHKQVDLPYIFNSYEGMARKETNSFKKQVQALIEHISEPQIIKKEIKKISHQKKIESLIEKKSKTNLNDNIVFQEKKTYPSSAVYNSLNGNFLGQEEGMISIWADVETMHNENIGNKKYLYLLSYDTNKGKLINNNLLAKYPNAWYVCRITPTKQEPRGVWIFGCNHIEPKTTELISRRMLDGWHMFTIAWSKKDDYIKFIIDEKIEGETSFINWPQNFKASIITGRWSDMQRKYFFQSNIGKLKILNVGYDEDYIKEIYKDKPNIIR
jgi:nucleoside 2-deoxyribosyltransferase